MNKFKRKEQPSQDYFKNDEKFELVIGMIKAINVRLNEAEKVIQEIHNIIHAEE